MPKPYRLVFNHGKSVETVSSNRYLKPYKLLRRARIVNLSFISTHGAKHGDNMVTITPIDSSGVFRMPVKTILRGLAFFKGDAYKVLVETIPGQFPSFRLEA
jgi:hypothetical protein